MDRPHFRGSLFSPEQFIRQHFNALMGEQFFVAGSFCSIMALEIYLLPEAAAEPKGKKKKTQQNNKNQNLSMLDLSEELATIKIPADVPIRCIHTERVKWLTVCVHLISSPVDLTLWPFSFETEDIISALGVIDPLSG